MLVDAAARKRANGLRVFLAAMVAGVALVALPPTIWAEEILIIRPLSNTQTTFQDEEITLEVEISAFETLTEVKINGELQEFAPADWITLTKRVQLRYGKNTFLVEAQAGTAVQKKEFVIFYDPKNEGLETTAAADKGRFILLGGLSNQSNGMAVGGGVGGLKLFTILIPGYTWGLSRNSSLELQGVVSRTKWDKKELEGFETQLTQVSVKRVAKVGQTAQWSVGGGMNYIDWGFGPVTGKGHQEKDWFVFFSFKNGFGNTGFNRYYGEHKQQDFENDPQDASVITLRWAMEHDFFGLRGKYKAEIADTGAREALNNNRAVRFTGEIGIPMGGSKAEPVEGEFDLATNPWMLGVGVKYGQTDYSDASADETLTTLFVNAGYPIMKGTHLLGELRRDSQASNVPELEYSNTAVSFSVITSF